jgi:hypothetical protein
MRHKLTSLAGSLQRLSSSQSRVFSALPVGRAQARWAPALFHAMATLEKASLSSYNQLFNINTVTRFNRQPTLPPQAALGGVRRCC